MAIEAEAVDAVIQDQITMLDQGPIVMPARLEHAVALHAVVFPAKALQGEPDGGTNRITGKMDHTLPL